MSGVTKELSPCDQGWSENRDVPTRYNGVPLLQIDKSGSIIFKHNELPSPLVSSAEHFGLLPVHVSYSSAKVLKKFDTCKHFARFYTISFNTTK